MRKNILLILSSLVLVVLAVSCNLYAPFNSKSSPEDFLEEAQKCLHNDDFACAVSNYENLPPGDLKNEKLCLAYMGKAGVTIDTLVNVVTKNDSTMLGSLANSLVPWNEVKGSDAASARDYCVALGGSTSSGDKGILLKTLGLMVDCGMRMAKSDKLIGSSDSDTACNTLGNRSGIVSKSDIDTGSGPGMCSTDVTICHDDFSNIDNSQLASAGLSEMKTALDQVPANLTSSVVTATIRAALQETVPAD